MTYKKLLVVAISTDEKLREEFENIFSMILNNHGVAAVPSNSLTNSLRQADRAQLQEMARRVDADAVAITRVVSKSEHTNYKLSTGSVQVRTAVMSESTANSSTTVVMSAVGIVPGEIDAREAVLETRFFDVGSTALVWSAKIEGSGYESKEAACWDISIELAKALTKENLIKPDGREFRNPSI